MTTANDNNLTVLSKSKLAKIPLLEDKFVDMKFITDLTGLSDKWFYQLIKDGKFPKAIKFGTRSRWRESEVEEWLQQRIFESRGLVRE